MQLTSTKGRLLPEMVISVAGGPKVGQRATGHRPMASCGALRRVQRAFGRRGKRKQLDQHGFPAGPPQDL